MAVRWSIRSSSGRLDQRKWKSLHLAQETPNGQLSCHPDPCQCFYARHWNNLKWFQTGPAKRKEVYREIYIQWTSENIFRVQTVANLEWLKQTLKQDLDVELRVRIHVVKEFLVVVKLLVPFDGFSVTEIISKWCQQHLGLKKLGFLPVLVQQQLSSKHGETKLSGGKSTSAQNWGNTNRQTTTWKKS